MRYVGPMGSYPVAFASTDDATLDAETTLLEDRRMTLEEIRAACTRYRVRARVFDDDGNVIKEIVPEDERPSSARLGQTK